MLRILLIAMISFLSFTSIASADRWDFGRFAEDGSNLPNSYQRIRDNFEGVEARRIHAFSIIGGECAVGAYSDGSGRGDCTYGSVRSMLREQSRTSRHTFAQPQQAWYAWDMLIPSDYPTHTLQAGGGYIFTQWKGMDCPHASIAHNSRRNGGNVLILRMMRTTGEHDCAATAEINLMPMDQFKGQWRHIEVFANWSTGEAGQFLVYIDGQQRGAYQRPTLDSNIRMQNGQRSEMNHFDFGSYLCCTGGVHLVQPGTLYFANVRRAGSRERLAQ